MPDDSRPTQLAWAVYSIVERRADAADPCCELATHRLQAAGHRVLEQGVLPPDPEEIRGTLQMLARDLELDAILMIGATGVGPRDIALRASEPLVGHIADGFALQFAHLENERSGAIGWLQSARAATIPAPDANKLLFHIPWGNEIVEPALVDLVIPSALPFFQGANPDLDLEERFAARGAQS